MENYAVIENILADVSEWNTLLDIALQTADKFSIVFPSGEYDEENFLLTGKLEIEQLPNLAIEPWPNMKDALVFSGRLDQPAKEVIYTYMHDTPEKMTYSLWNFSLYKEEVELLNVQDFNVCLINIETEFIQSLRENNINV